jgi:hypothetical protein
MSSRVTAVIAEQDDDTCRAMVRIRTPCLGDLVRLALTLI